MGKAANKLELPLNLKKFHQVFQINLLKLYHEDMEDSNRSISKRALIGAKMSYNREVKTIITDQVTQRKYHPPSQQYLVKWKELPDNKASWEPAKGLWKFKDQIDLFHRGNKNVASMVGGGCPVLPFQGFNM